MFPHCSSLSRGPPWGAEPGLELGIAVQQADAQQLSELRRTLRSYAKKFAKYSYYQRNAIMMTNDDNRLKASHGKTDNVCAG